MKIWKTCFILCMGWGAAAQAQAPLEDRIWDVRHQQFISEDTLVQRLAQARYVLLGETHDSVAHHARQLRVLQALTARGLTADLAMEQFDSEHQVELTRVQGTGQKDAEALADAGQLNRQGWRWPMYKELIAHAAQHSWPLLAANLSRGEARKIVLGEVQPFLRATDLAQQALLEYDVISGHCGHRPEPARLAGMVTAQRARDVRMAQVLDSVPGPVVLIAGAGHVRADRAVPRYLSQPAQALTVGMVEVRADKPAAADYDSAGFDYLWFTPGQHRPDPCSAPLKGLAAPVSSNSNSKDPK